MSDPIDVTEKMVVVPEANLVAGYMLKWLERPTRSTDVPVAIETENAPSVRPESEGLVEKEPLGSGGELVRIIRRFPGLGDYWDEGDQLRLSRDARFNGRRPEAAFSNMLVQYVDAALAWYLGQGQQGEAQHYGYPIPIIGQVEYQIFKKNEERERHPYWGVSRELKALKGGLPIRDALTLIYMTSIARTKLIHFSTQWSEMRVSGTNEEGFVTAHWGPTFQLLGLYTRFNEIAHGSVVKAFGFAENGLLVTPEDNQYGTSVGLDFLVNAIKSLYEVNTNPSELFNPFGIKKKQRFKGKDVTDLFHVMNHNFAEVLVTQRNPHALIDLMRRTLCENPGLLRSQLWSTLDVSPVDTELWLSLRRLAEGPLYLANPSEIIKLLSKIDPSKSKMLIMGGGSIDLSSIVHLVGNLDADERFFRNGVPVANAKVRCTITRPNFRGRASSDSSVTEQVYEEEIPLDVVLFLLKEKLIYWEEQIFNSSPSTTLQV